MNLVRKAKENTRGFDDKSKVEEFFGIPSKNVHVMGDLHPNPQPWWDLFLHANFGYRCKNHTCTFNSLSKEEPHRKELHKTE